ncbi:unnamed protein product, partial [Effrenium voratum]
MGLVQISAEKRCEGFNQRRGPERDASPVTLDPDLDPSSCRDMSFDRSAAERLASDCAASMHEAARRFSAGIQELLDHAAAEAARERQQILEESTALARERQRLEEAWQHLNLERARMEAGGPVSSGHKPNLYPSPRETEQEASLSTSRFSTVAGGPIPNHYIVTVADRAYTVLPLKE